MGGKRNNRRNQNARGQSKTSASGNTCQVLELERFDEKLARDCLKFYSDVRPNHIKPR